MAASPKLFLLCGLLVGLAACKNECQQLCTDMADFAADECNQEFDKDQLKACNDAYKKSNLEEGAIETCEEVRPFLQEEWTCEEIGEYFDAAAGSGGGTDGADGTDGTDGTERHDSGM